jgi:hypothetical protein
MTRTTAVIALSLATLAVTVPRGQVVVNETRVVTQGPGGMPAGRGAPAPIPLGTGLIVGQVVEADSTTPVPGVLVTLMLPASSPLRVLADGQGRFAFRQLPKGSYNITVSRAGYVDGAHGRVRPGGPTQPVVLDEGARVGGISIPIWKFAAVGGYVVDENSDPVIGAQVRVLRRSIVGGHWRLVPGPTDLTDDRGAYRIGALEPGEYVVAVPMNQSQPSIDSFMPVDGPREAAVAGVMTLRVAAAGAGGGGPMRVETMLGGGGAGPPPDEDGRPRAYPTQFYPAASTSARAAAVALGSGEERTGLDFQLKPVRTMRVSGTILGPDGPAGNMPVTLVPAEAGDLATPIETLRAFSDASGSFSFAGVPAGQYSLHASRTTGGGPVQMISAGGNVMMVRTVVGAGGRGRGAPPLPDQPALWAETSIAVDSEDLENLAIALRPGFKVTGQVQFDGTAARPAPEQLSSVTVSLEPADAAPGMPRSTARGRIDPSGTFETMGVPPGKYFVRVGGAPQNWYFLGAMAGGVDVADRPLELDSDASGVMLTFTDRSSDLSGQVTTGGSADGPVTVIVFPADSSAWIGYGSSSRRLRSLRADGTGSYTASNLPPGDYLVAAVPDKRAGDWQNPAFLESLAASATRVRVGAGEKVTQNLQVVR